MEESVRSHSALWVWVALFVLLTLVLLAGGYAYYRQETQRIRQGKYQEIAAIAKLKAEQIKEWREERRKDLWRALKAPFFRKAVEEWLRHPDNSAAREELRQRLVVEQQEEGYSEVLLLDKEGHLLLSSALQPTSLNPATKRLIEEALSKRAPLLGDLYRGSQGIVHLDAVAPVLDRDEKPIAALLLRSNAEGFLYPMIQAWPTPSRTAETLLVRREGDELLFLNDLRHRPDSALSLREPLTLKTLPAVQAVQGKQGIFQGLDYRGVEVVADLRAIPDSPWFMVAKVDASEILAEARYRGGVIALFSVLFILFAAGVTAYGYRHRQVRLYRDLYRSESETRAAQEEFRTTLYSIGDAVITTDTKGLVKQMNPVAEEITGWQEAEARGKPLHEVFRIVNEESRDEVENPVKRVLREGMVVGLANHTLLIAKDGTERPIADSGAPIRDDRGAITGVVLVFRDQTQERQAQKDLQESEERYRGLWEKAPVMMISLDSQARIMFASDRFCEALGYGRDEVLGRRTFEFQTEDSARHAQSVVFPRFLRTGKVKEEPLQLVKKNGKVMDVLLSASAERDDNGNMIRSRSVYTDITDRKRAEEALRASEAFLNSVIDQSPNPMWISDHQGTLIRANKALLDLLHISDEEVVGKYNILSDNIVEEQGALPLIKSVFEKGDTVRFEIRYDSSQLMQLQLKQSAFVALDVTVFPIKDSNGKTTNAVIQHIDITEREKAEEELKHSEERYRQLVEMSLDAIAVQQDGVLAFVNPAAAKMLGAESPDELIGKPVQDFVHPDYWEATKSRLQRMFQGETGLFPVENWYVRLDGTVVPVEVTASLLTYGGKPAVQVIARDISERKKAEDALRASEEKFSSAFQNSPDPITITRLTDGRLIDVNERFVQISGYSREEALGRTSVELDLWSNPADREKYVSALTEKGRITDFETSFKARSGEPRSFLVSGERIEMQGEPCILGILHDITERKRTEAALRTSEAQLSNALRMAHLGHWEYDVAQDLFTFNDQFYEIFRTTAEQMSGYTMSSAEYARRFVHPEDMSVVADETRKAIETDDPGFSRQLEHRMVYADGKIGYISVRFFVVKDELGRTVKTYGVNQDITERKKAEQDLQERTRLNQVLLDAFPCVALLIRPHTREIVAGNAAAIEVGAVPGTTCFSTWGQREASCPWCLAPELWATGDAQHLEVEALGVSWDAHWIPVGPDLYMHFAFDITERNKAEQAVRESEERYRSLFENMVEGYAYCKMVFEDGEPQDFIYLDVNEAFEKLTGLKNVIGKRVTEAIPGIRKSNPELFEVYGRVALTGNPEKLETYVEPLGIWFSVSVYSTEREHFVAVFDNITERREAEAALRFERQQLLSLFESINEVIVVIDPKTYEILYANKFTEDLYGKSLVGGLCYEKLNGFGGPCDHCLNEQVMSLQGKPYQWEYHSSALNRHFLATDRMIRWPDGRDVKFQLAIDITERKRAEQEKEDLSSQLLQAQKMEAIGTLAGGVAHDFNNLLQVVLGYSELILSDEDFDGRYRDDLNKILQAAQNGAELVQRLLIFGRKTDTKPKPLNFNRQIDQARKILSRTIPKMIEIDLVLAEDLATVHVDPVQMDQILMNLAVNARDAMPEGGKLIIETRNISLEEEYCHAHLGAKPGDYVLMSLSDTGHGMDKDTLEHIFEPFYTTKRPGEGTGLGLAMVYGIVKQHNGHIMCYSEPGRGTTFKVYFPAEVSEIEYQREHTRSVPPGGTETILLVDDESLLQELGERILTKAGYAVLVAGNGKEALEVYRNEQDRIGLVILDLIMPEMGGKQCLEELLRINSDAKVLIASGHSASASTEETTEIGARGFVAKPYDVRQLLETVRKVLDS